MSTSYVAKYMSVLFSSPRLTLYATFVYCSQVHLVAVKQAVITALPCFLPHERECVKKAMYLHIQQQH